MKKALLILFGGRAMPNMLTILHEKPDLIVPIISQDVQDEVPLLKKAVSELFDPSEYEPQWDTSAVVNAFLLEKVEEKCLELVKNHTDFEWIFNVTAATKIMSLGAYAAANKLVSEGKPVRCWYLDTAHGNVVSLIGPKGDSDIFKISVPQYVTSCYCSIADGHFENYRITYENNWLPFAQCVGKDPKLTQSLKELLKLLARLDKEGASKLPGRNHPTTYALDQLTDHFNSLLDLAHQTGVISQLKRENSRCAFMLDYVQYQFLNGTWLEVYVWDVVRNMGDFDSCLWNKSIQDTHGRTNQFDVALTYYAQLILVECKTGRDAFAAATFHTFESIGNALGNKFATKIIVTGSEPTKDEEQRAKSSRIAIITDLSNIGLQLLAQATNPDHPRL
jgi:hypothetical protein